MNKAKVLVYGIFADKNNCLGGFCINSSALRIAQSATNIVGQLVKKQGGHSLMYLME